MIIDCAHYQDGRRRDAGAVPLEEAAARCGQGGFVWLGLFEPSDEELAPVCNGPVDRWYHAAPYWLSHIAHEVWRPSACSSGKMCWAWSTAVAGRAG